MIVVTNSFNVQGQWSIILDYFADYISELLTFWTGYNITFESASVPWRLGTIRLENVKIVCNEETWKTLQKKIAYRDGVEYNPGEVNTNFAYWDATVESIDVTLSLWRWLDGRGVVKDAKIRGIRGVCDRTHITWDNWVPSRRTPHFGDFELDSLIIEDALVTICNPRQRPIALALFNAKLPTFRRQWLLYDWLCADSIVGTLEDCLFSVHKPQTKDLRVQNELRSNWSKLSNMKMYGLPISHLNNSAKGPLSWITKGTIDLDLHILVPHTQQDEDLFDKILDEVDGLRYEAIHKFEAFMSPSDKLPEETQKKISLREMRQYGLKYSRNEPDTEIEETNDPLLSVKPSSNMIMLGKVKVKDIKANVPIVNESLSYMSSALIRPVVGYLNANKIMENFNGAWDIYSAGLVDVLSEEMGRAVAGLVNDEQEQAKRLKEFGLWSLAEVSQKILNVVEHARGDRGKSEYAGIDTFSATLPNFYPLAMTQEDFLHRLVYKNDPAELQKALGEAKDVNILHRGQTPLTLAITLGYKDCVKTLLDFGCSTLVPNEFGWMPFQEATSYGNRDIMRMVYLAKREEYSKWVDEKGKKVLNELSLDLQDFSAEMNWSFTSFIPFVSSLCPSDTYTITKKGNCVRIDTTLVGFERLNWIRGNISIIFNGDGPDPKLVIVDHDTKTVQQVWPRDFSLTDEAVEEDISVALNTPINKSPDFHWQSFNISRAKSGFLFKYNRNENIEGYPTSVWNIDSFTVSFPTRTEHLSANPLPQFKIIENKLAAKKAAKEQKAKEAANKPKSRFVIANPDNSDSESDDNTYLKKEAEEEEQIRNYKAGYRNIQDGVDEDDEELKAAKRAFAELAAFRGSLDPPNPCQIALEDYLARSDSIHLGRAYDLDLKERTFSGKLWIYKPLGDPNTDLETVPINFSILSPILELVGLGNEHLRSFTNFIDQSMPEGFPIQIELPIGMLPLSANIRFQNIKKACEQEKGWFDIPKVGGAYRAGEVVRAVEDAL
ncbi:Mitochondrial distribution and morphology protein 31, mitochondrial precursor [Terramyces sp. JEL0728]|nr:Mitochondrial distribution and morphology protein 31, mitochondrial precursor [Terramyces sp. JEL0728]